MRTIICNVGYGNGPILGAVEVASAVRDRVQDRCRIIAPLLYGKSQERIAASLRDRDDLHLDATLGRLIRSVTYEGDSYDAFLRHWLENVGAASQAARDYILATYGRPTIEIARAPMIGIDLAPSFCTLFARRTDIWGRACDEPAVSIDRGLLRTALERMQSMEERHSIRFYTQPGSFGRNEESEADVAIPPTLKVAPPEASRLRTPSAYVTVSGIPRVRSGVATLAGALDLPLYTNRPDLVPGARYASPDLLADPRLVLHVARAGWGAAWASLLTGTPLLTPPFDESDDPEILYNNRRVTELGIGLVVDEVPQDAIEATRPMPARMRSYLRDLEKRFGTLDGASIAAERIQAALEA